MKTITSTTTRTTRRSIMTMMTLLLLLMALLDHHVHAIRIIPSTRSNDNHQQIPTTNNSTTTSRHYHRQQKEQQKQVHVDIPTSPNDHLVTSLPLLDENAFKTKQWAGHLPVSDDHNNYFFYWLFEPDFSSLHDTVDKKDDVPLIIWLNGGPACSSMDGLFIENGPFRLTKNPETSEFELIPDQFSWHKQVPAYTVYVDQPVGTGLSFTTNSKYPTNDHEINVDFYYFLQQFFILHKDKFVDVDSNAVFRQIYFSGESYAGHYIPSMINYILKQREEQQHRHNRNLNHNDEHQHKIDIPVHGGAIGNGWTDPFYQYAGAQFAYGHGIIDFRQVAKFNEMETTCQKQLNKGKYNVPICFDLIDDILAQSHGGSTSTNTKASGYDVRKSESKHGSRTFPPGHKIIETYLGGKPLPTGEIGTMPDHIYIQVLESLHATAATKAGQKYRECTDPPYNALSGQDGKGVVDDVVSILKHPNNVKLLFFNGIHDIICNHVGNEKFLEHLPWEHTPDWMSAARYAWVADSSTAGGEGGVSGYMKEYANLQFLKILDAGHMVPMDVPGVAADMMRLFVYGGSFDSSKQNLEGDSDDSSDTCPVCPKCRDRDSGADSDKETIPGSKDDDNNHSSSSSDKAMGTFVISYAWGVAGAAVVVFVLVFTILRRKSNNSITHANNLAAIPQYELELRDGTYRDEPEDGEGGSGVI